MNIVNIVNFNLKVLKTDKELTNDAKQILTASKKDFALRVYKDKSNVGPIYTDRLIADEIFRSISEIVGRDFRKRTLLEDLPFEEREKVRIWSALLLLTHLARPPKPTTALYTDRYS